nr:cyanophycinase [Terriglobales bacterium]
ALMGGGSDLDEAFHWLCGKAGGGDFLILRARGDDAYNKYVNGLCHANSVATLIIPDRQAAQDPAVARIISEAEAVFLAGGDQARYVNFWKGTPVEDAINRNIAEHKPIGGTSAGLAILGQFAYGALNDKEDDADLSSAEVLRNPYFGRVTLVRDFLKVPHLENTLTDSHFAKRNRMGRSLGFLARIVEDGWSRAPREIAVDEKSAVLMDSDGAAKVVGPGRGAYFMEVTEPPQKCQPDVALTFRGISVHHVRRGDKFDIAAWSGPKSVNYSLTVTDGVIASTQSGGLIY